ncbi:hypothetical protein [Streptomyces sp. NPDC046197]|uniref:hypothetical protein n=1 Tax=Streptomyces sp. NPDC046197 TaxID=3154337 RepID=UPI0033D68DEB
MRQATPELVASSGPVWQPDVTTMHAGSPGLLPPGKPLIDVAPYCAPHHWCSGDR